MPIFFLKFGGADVNEAFFKIDTDFQKLSSESTDTIFKIGGHIKHDINDIGGAFFKLSDGFTDLADGAFKVDTAFIKLAGGGTTTDAGGGGGSTQTDFLTLDATLKTSAGDIKILGADFVKLTAAPNLLTIKLTDRIISGDLRTIATDMSDAGAAFLKLGTDLVAMGTGENSNSPQLNEALKILGSDFEDKISPAFDAVALDWNKLSQDFAHLGGSKLGSAGSDSTPGTVGSDFLKLEHDFQLLNSALGAAGPDIKATFDAFADQIGKPSEDHDHDNNVLAGSGNVGHG